jgi:uncharacterized membrane protein YkvA (DUF1232 family)
MPGSVDYTAAFAVHLWISIWRYLNPPWVSHIPAWLENRGGVVFRLFSFWRWARQDLSFLWFALRQPGRPAWLWPAAAFLALYAVDPANFALPMLGAVDDFVLLPVALHLLLKWLPAEIRASFAAKSLLRQGPD